MVFDKERNKIIGETGMVFDKSLHFYLDLVAFFHSVHLEGYFAKVINLKLEINTKHLKKKGMISTCKFIQ